MIPLDYLLDLIGQPRTIDFNGVDYPNYGAFDADLSVGDRASAACDRDGRGKIGMGKAQAGKGSRLGIAAHRSFLTYVATVVEVEVNDQGDSANSTRGYGGGRGLGRESGSQPAHSSRVPQCSAPAWPEAEKSPPRKA